MLAVRWILTVVTGLLLDGGAQGAAERDLLGLSSAAAGDRLPPDWQDRPVRGARAPTSVVRVQGQGPLFSISGQGQAAWYGRDLRGDPLASNGTAILQFRTPILPVGADLTRSAQSDAALRLYFVFDAPRLGLRRPRTLFYSIGAVPRGPRTTVADRICDIRVAHADTASWQQLSFAPASDAAAHCQWTVERIQAVGIMQDTDQTGAQAAVEIRAFRWRH
jgi:hypothetical protein